MSAGEAVSLTVSVVIAMYLVFALLRGEKL